MENEVYKMTEDDGGYCYYCHKYTPLLAGPSHSPYDGNANYICEDCLDFDAVIIDMSKP